MTTDEAIDYMERCADGLDPDFDNAVSLAVAALRAQQEAENPKPLTLDELHHMTGEPVWVESPGMRKYGRWAIVAGVDTEDGEHTLYLGGDYTCRDYGKALLAYRCKPKEGTT